MKVRRADIDDVRRIAEIHVQSWRVAYGDSLPAGFLASLDEHQREAMWRSCVKSKGRLFVVEDDDQIIGFLCLSTPRDEDIENATELTAIYLDPQFYGHGIGTTFWREIEKDLDTDSAYLWVLSTNPIGIAFYEKNGFRPDGKKKTFEIGDQEFEELRYSKFLHNQSVRSDSRSAPSGRD